MALTWVVTLPAAAMVGALTYAVVNAIGSTAGVLVMSLVLAAFCGVLYMLSRRSPVDPSNVNAEWDAHGGLSHEPQLAA
jgi:PiT family inorganic phosphate transporter